MWLGDVMRRTSPIATVLVNPDRSPIITHLRQIIASEPGARIGGGPPSDRTAGRRSGRQTLHDEGASQNPSSPIGAPRWGSIDGFSVCATGTKQSPVNIETARVEVRHVPPLLLKYQMSEVAIETQATWSK
jgi:Eukaryotic-type carbonic anhydrase